MRAGASFFITGTDTGIGKTVAATVLAVGMGARYWKPIQTGSSEGTDSDFVRQWIGREQVWPESYIYPEPLSPHRAAEMHAAEIDFKKCVADSRKIQGPKIIEGAGGVLVPINSSFLMADLIAALAIPAIVVCGTRLGTINHTLLTLEALERRNIRVAGVISMGEENRATQKAIRDYGNARILGHIPSCAVFSSDWFRGAYENLSIFPQEGESWAIN